MTLRTCNFCKAFGGVLMVLGLPATLLILLRVRILGSHPEPLMAAVWPGVIGLLGTAIFVLAQREAKSLRKDAEQHQEEPALTGTDWKGMLIFGICFVLAIVLFVLFAALSDHLGR